METAKTLLTIGSLIGARKALRAMRGLHVDGALGAVGLERRGHGDTLLPTIGVIAVSAAVGAGLAMLLAPSPGVDLRRRIATRATDAKRRVAEQVAEYQRKLKSDKPMHS